MGKVVDPVCTDEYGPIFGGGVHAPLGATGSRFIFFLWNPKIPRIGCATPPSFQPYISFDIDPMINWDIWLDRYLRIDEFWFIKRNIWWRKQIGICVQSLQKTFRF